MQMSHAYSQAAQISSRLHTDQPVQREHTSVEDASAQAKRQQAHKHSETGQSTSVSATSSTGATAKQTSQQVLAKYDLTDISPVEVDKMAGELRSSGFDDVGFILGLETRGANWRSHMQGALGDAGYEYDGNYDANQKTDVIASTRTQLEMAQKYGEPTDFLTDQLAKMEEYHAQGHPQTATASSAQMAETLVLFQAQRVWVE